jgi:polar amino acid transport system ATP-binding protein
MLNVEKLSKAYGSRSVLQDLSLRVRPGTLSVLIGRSGCGKSTLLRCLNGLEHPDSGSVQLAGNPLHYPLSQNLRLKIGMVFQSFNLFPHLNVEQNLMAAPMTVKGLPESEARDLSYRLLSKVGLLEQRRHYPSQLSGGQQQRAAIARALAMRPQVLLYDEPTSSLDPHLAKEVLDVMLRLKKDGMTQVLVTHEHSFAARAADEAFFIEEGVVLESGPARKIFKSPKDRRTRRFVAGLK